MHACMGMSAMQMGLHVYGQKTTDPRRRIPRPDRIRKRKQTDDPNGYSNSPSTQYRTAVQIVHDGVIGKVKGNHIQQQEMGDANPKPNRKDPVPEGLDWDVWIGPAPTLTSSKAIITRANGEASRLRNRHLWGHGLPHL